MMSNIGADMSVKVLIVTGDGVNCEQETKRAFELAGANCEIKHINDFSDSKVSLSDYQILALPGGFSFGDELGSGKVFALKIKNYLESEIKEFVAAKKPVIGICNGFQVLTKLGIFNNNELNVGLAHNHHGRFMDQWTSLSVVSKNSIWLDGIDELYLPIRHGEGRFVSNDNENSTLEKLTSNGQVALTYQHNPNGSMGGVAGISDTTGLVLGLMPHPEAAIKDTLYPGGEVQGQIGLKLFENAVEYCKGNL
jgi:phosphoribosylformylglycinamidine synthase